MEVISRGRMSNQRRILLEDHRRRATRARRKRKRREIFTNALDKRNKGSKKRYPKPPSWARQACWPSKQALGPSAPTKGLLYLQNIYKIPTNNPFITLCLRCPVYLPLLSNLRLWGTMTRLAVFIPPSTSLVLALQTTANASSEIVSQPDIHHHHHHHLQHNTSG